MKRATLMAILPLALLGSSLRSHPAWRSCPGDPGGAFQTRVAGMSCREAGVITEGGLTSGTRSTRIAHLSCTRAREARLWAYRCVSANGHRLLRFTTF